MNSIDRDPDTPLWRSVGRGIGDATGQHYDLVQIRRLGGGDTSSAFRVSDGATHYFVKLSPADRVEMFAAESEGLRELRASREVRAPRPVYAGTAGEHAYLVLEYLRLGSANEERMASLGRTVARMHRVTRERYGWHMDNAIGLTPQRNAPMDHWGDFWVQQRLEPQMALARTHGLPESLLDACRGALERAQALLSDHTPQPSLLHGDLWSGNAGFLAHGEPVIFDPAVYYGDRETDLAMSELFGLFPPAFYAAYDTAWPRDAGYEQRRPLYQLYHLLNHYNLFGEAYLERLENCLAQLVGRPE